VRKLQGNLLHKAENLLGKKHLEGSEQFLCIHKVGRVGFVRRVQRKEKNSSGGKTLMPSQHRGSGGGRPEVGESGREGGTQV